MRPALWLFASLKGKLGTSLAASSKTPSAAPKPSTPPSAQRNLQRELERQEGSDHLCSQGPLLVPLTRDLAVLESRSRRKPWDCSARMGAGAGSGNARGTGGVADGSSLQTSFPKRSKQNTKPREESILAWQGRVTNSCSPPRRSSHAFMKYHEPNLEPHRLRDIQCLVVRRRMAAQNQGLVCKENQGLVCTGDAVLESTGIQALGAAASFAHCRSGRPVAHPSH